MAITKYNLYDSASGANSNALCLEFLREALIPDWLGENGTVEPKSGEANTYVLTDGDGNEIAELNNRAGAGSVGITVFYIDSGHNISFASSGGDWNKFITGYKTSKGAMIIMTSTSYGNCGILIFGKTNNGKLAMVLKDTSAIYTGGAAITGYTATAYGAKVGARDDDISALGHDVTFVPMMYTFGTLSSNENQTILCPTPTHSNPGETSIIDGVFMMPWAQFRNEGKIQIGNKYYATNGYWALED